MLEFNDPAVQHVCRELSYLRAWMLDYPITKIGFDNYIKVIENKIISFNAECAFVFDCNHNYLFTKIGNRRCILFGDSACNIPTNSIITHNHPKDATFSLADIKFFIDYKLLELRAVSKRHTFSLRSSKCDEYTYIDDDAYSDFTKATRNAHKLKMVGNVRESELNDSWERLYIQYLVDKYGLIYEETRNPNYSKHNHSTVMLREIFMKHNTNEESFYALS
jgi:hypothetical protein